MEFYLCYAGSCAFDEEGTGELQILILTTSKALQAYNDWVYNEEKFQELLYLSKKDWTMVEEIVEALKVTQLATD